jgi:hypothetical protein
MKLTFTLQIFPANKGVPVARESFQTLPTNKKQGIINQINAVNIIKPTFFHTSENLKTYRDIYSNLDLPIRVNKSPINLV